MRIRMLQPTSTGHCMLCPHAWHRHQDGTAPVLEAGESLTTCGWHGVNNPEMQSERQCKRMFLCLLKGIYCKPMVLKNCSKTVCYSALPHWQAPKILGASNLYSRIVNCSIKPRVQTPSSSTTRHMALYCEGAFMFHDFSGCCKIYFTWITWGKK